MFPRFLSLGNWHAESLRSEQVMLFACSFAVVAGLDGVEGQSKLHASHCRRAIERVQDANVCGSI